MKKLSGNPENSSLVENLSHALSLVRESAGLKLAYIKQPFDRLGRWISNNPERYIGIMDILGHAGMMYSGGEFRNLGRFLSSSLGMVAGGFLAIVGGRPADDDAKKWEEKFEGLTFSQKILQLIHPKTILFNVRHNPTRAYAAINLLQTMGYATLSGPDSLGKIAEAGDVDFAKSNDQTRISEILLLGGGGTLGGLMMIMKESETPAIEFQREKEICASWGQGDLGANPLWKAAAPAYKIGAFFERRAIDLISVPFRKAVEAASYGPEAVFAGGMSGLFQVAANGVQEIRDVGPNFFAAYLFQGICIADMIDSHAKKDYGKVAGFVIWMIANYSLSNLSQNRVQSPAELAPK